MPEILFLGVNGSCQDMDSSNTSLIIRGSSASICVDLSGNVAPVVDENIDAVILTHEHIDHIYALPSLLHQLWLSGRTRPLTIIVPFGMKSIPEELIRLFCIREKKNIFQITVSENIFLSLGSLQITLFPTDHTNTSVGIIAEEGGRKLVYTSDTRPLFSVPEWMHDIDVLIHEASGTEDDEELLVKKGHSSGADAGKLAAALQVQKLYLCHLPRGQSTKAKILMEAAHFFPDAEIPELYKIYSV